MEITRLVNGQRANATNLNKPLVELETAVTENEEQLETLNQSVNNTLNTLGNQADNNSEKIDNILISPEDNFNDRGEWEGVIVVDEFIDPTTNAVPPQWISGSYAIGWKYLLRDGEKMFGFYGGGDGDDDDDDEDASWYQTVNHAVPTTLKIRAYVSTEKDFDYLIISINGEEVFAQSGEDSNVENNFYNLQYSLEAGINNIEIRFIKDDSVADGTDSVGIVSMQYTSALVGAAVYQKFDTVTFDDLVYICTADDVNTAPESLVGWNALDYINGAVQRELDGLDHKTAQINKIVNGTEQEVFFGIGTTWREDNGDDEGIYSLHLGGGRFRYITTDDEFELNDDLKINGDLEVTESAWFGHGIEVDGDIETHGDLIRDGEIVDANIIHGGSGLDRYAKFDDGTLICTRRVLVVDGEYSVNIVWPSQFTITPTVTISPVNTGYHARCLPDASGGQVFTYDYSGNPDNTTQYRYVNIIAIGRWK